jgi:hypothetical protein
MKTLIDLAREKGTGRLEADDLNGQGILPPLLADLDNQAGNLIGTGDGAMVTEDEFGPVLDFGPCSWCEHGHYMAYSANALWGECNWCGAT